MIHVRQDYLTTNPHLPSAVYGSVAQAEDSPEVERRPSRSLTTQDPDPSSVDAIVRAGRFPVPAAEPASAAITDRRETTALGLGDAIEQLRDRYAIYRRHIEELERAKLATVNAARTWFTERPGGDPTKSETVHRILQDLYGAQRQERLRLWQDVSRLRQSVPDWAAQYLSAYRKSRILEDGGPDRGGEAR